MPEQRTLDVDAVFTEHMEAPKQPTIDVDEPHTEHMDDAMRHRSTSTSPCHRSGARKRRWVRKPRWSRKEAEFESFDAPSFEAPNFKEEARAGDGQVRVATHGWSRYTTAECATPSTCRRARVVRCARTAASARTRRCASLRGRRSRPKSRASQTVGSGTIVLGRGGVRFVPGEAPRRHPRNTDGPARRRRAHVAGRQD